ncbi:MAG: glycosyltransferase family 2 protein [Ignavibacteriales bacterium]|nr:glycosyltransferase family 2 protein [Ignavibacteriales bacterium]
MNGNYNRGKDYAVVLSLCMIIKNEEKYLRDCLESVKDVAEEIIIVDTGSSDKSLEIAESFDSNIFHFTWINNFSAARNFAISKCTGDWILYLDADERLSAKSISELKVLVSRNENIGIKCIVKNIDAEFNRTNTMKYTRLFRNQPEVKFAGRVHEQIDSSLLQLKYKIVDSSIEIIHLGYNISSDAKKGKAKRNLQLLLEDYETSNSAYCAYQLAQTYNVLDDNENAIKFSFEALEKNELNIQQRAISCGLISNIYLKEHKVEAAHKFVIEGLKFDGKQPYLNLLASKIYLRLQNLSKAEYYCAMALEQNNRLFTGNNYSSIDIILSEDEIIYFGIILAIQSENKKNLDFYLTALEKYLRIQPGNNFDKKIGLIKKLCSKIRLSENEEMELVGLINRKNLDYFLEFLRIYNFSESKLRILEKLAYSFSKEPGFVSLYGVTLADNNLVEKAITVLESLVDSNESEPSTLFHLISLYVKSNQVNKISGYINFLETNYSNIPEIKARLPLLKQKLTALF